MSSIDVDLIYLPQHSVSQAKKVTMEWLQIQKSMILLPILSVKDLPIILASSIINWGTQAQIS